MQYRSAPRADSPTHQHLYKRNGSPSVTRCRSSITPSRMNINSNGFALAVVPPSTSPRHASRAGAPADAMVYVADVNPVYSITATVRCFIPVNDRIIWSAEYDGTLCVRALPKGTSLRTIPGRKDTCCISLLYVQDEEQVWAGFQDGYLHVYDGRTMELLKETMAHSGGLHCMTQVEDTVFTGGADWKVCQWSFVDGVAQLLRTLHGHRGGVRSFGVYDGPTGAVLFSGSDDGTIRAWDPYTPITGESDSDAANIHTFAGHRRAVLSLAVVSHVNQLWSGGEDMTVRVWDMQTLECLSVLRGGHTAPIANLMVVESRVWSADKHGHILLWDISTRSLLQDLADRVPYWGIGQGMILAMQKVQPTTAYKVWTAASNGVLQCWNAETIPIIFDDVPIAAGTNRAAAAAVVPAITADGGLPCSNNNNNGSATSTPTLRGTQATDASAPTVSTNNNMDNEDYKSGNSNVASPVQAAATARMQEHVQRLQRDLQSVQRDAKLNYEKYRLEVQLEIETQQLLAQENERLRERVAELEDMAGVPHKDIRAEPAGSVGSARRKKDNGTPANGLTVSNVEAWTAEIVDLRKQLEEAHQQLNEVLCNRDQQQRQQRGRRYDYNSHEESPEISVSDLAADPARQFVRQDDFTKLPSATEDALSDSTAFQGRNCVAAHATHPYSALLSLPHESRWDEGIIKRTSLARHFSGGNWEYLLNEKPYELHTTLMADLCAGLGVAPTQLERVDLHDDGLTIEVDVIHPSTVPAAELERRMQEYRFPGITKMHTDALTTPKTGPDTAEATIIDLQEQLANVEKALAEAQEKRKQCKEEEESRLMERSPEPQQPYSNTRAGQFAHEDTLNAATAAAAAEHRRLKEANTQLEDELQNQLRTIQRLKNDVEDKAYELGVAQTDLSKKDDELKRVQQLLEEEQEQHKKELQQLQQEKRQQQEQQTPIPHRLHESGDSSDLRGQRLYDSAAPPAVDCTAHKKAESESGRPTELIAIPLAQEMSAASDRLSGVVEIQSQQQQQGAEALKIVAQLRQALAEANAKITALEAEKNARVDGAATARELRGENFQLVKQQQTHEDQQEQLQRQQPKLAQTEKQNAELQCVNETLAGKVVDLSKKLDALEQELKAERQKLAAAAAATPTALAKSPGVPHAATSTGKNNSSHQQTFESEDMRQLREDHEALNNYLHDQLKPMISRLKRARGELQLDKDRLLKRLEVAEEAAAAAMAVADREKMSIRSKKNDSSAATPAKASAGEEKPRETPVSASAALAGLSAATPREDESLRQLREDYEALDNYLHDQLKPMISWLKRTRGELELDLSRAQKDLQQACDMYEEAASALDEARVREEKMGETMEALRKALEAEQQKNQNTAAGTQSGQHSVNGRLQSETPSGRPTEPAQLHSMVGNNGGNKEDAVTKQRDPATPPVPPLQELVPQQRQEQVNARDAVNRLAAQNLDLSVRLADAEAIIAQLRESLGQSADQLARQRSETNRLLSKIVKFQQTGLSHDENVPSVSTSDSQ